MKTCFLLLCAIAFTAAASPVLAQSEQRSAVVEVQQIAPVTASEQPRIGEVAVDESGNLAKAYFKEVRVCSIRGCSSFIYDRRTDALVARNEVWSSDYAATNRGRQIIRVKQPVLGAARHQASNIAPSDEPLKTAARVRIYEETDANNEADASLSTEAKEDLLK